MDEKIFSQKFTIASYNVNIRKKLGLYGLLNFIQEVGFQHAHHLNIKLNSNQGWVFTRQKLNVLHWPKWGETLETKTWIAKSDSNLFTKREYEIFLNDKKIAECVSTFSVLDLVTRKMEAMNQNQIHLVAQESRLTDLVPKKIEPLQNFNPLTSFVVRNSDLDMNNHVNNTKYAQWILDALPLSVITSNDNVAGYEINFLSEVKPNERIIINSAQKENDSDIYQFQGVRSEDKKVVFLAEMIKARSEG